MTKRIGLFCTTLILISGAVGCVARNVVVRVTEGRTGQKKDGVFYALPRTVARVELPVIRETETDGVYKEFAECFFPGEKVITCKKKEFVLGDPVITPRAEPDPDQIFMVKIKSHWLEDRKMDLTWAEGGTLVKGEVETTNRTIDVLAQAAKTGVSLLTKAGLFSDRLLEGKVLSAEQKKNLPTECAGQNIEKLLADFETLADPDPKNRKALPPAALKLGNAVRDYLKILDLQEVRSDLIRGAAVTAPVETFKSLLEEIDSRIKELKEMFLGSKSKKIWNARFEVTPLSQLWSGRAKTFRLFELSKEAGVCQLFYSSPEVAFPGLKVPGEFLANCNLPTTGCEEKIPGRQPVAIKFELPDRQFSSRIDNAFDGNSESGERGFYYRIPAAASASVLLGDAPLFRVPLPIAQLGITASLPSSSGGRRTKYTVELTETGALKNFVLGSDAVIQASTVKDFGDAATAALDARAEAKKAEAAAKDEGAKVKGLADLLAECKKIKDAQVALGLEVNLPKKCLE